VCNVLRIRGLDATPAVLLLTAQTLVLLHGLRIDPTGALRPAASVPAAAAAPPPIRQQEPPPVAAARERSFVRLVSSISTAALGNQSFHYRWS